MFAVIHDLKLNDSGLGPREGSSTSSIQEASLSSTGLHAERVTLTKIMRCSLVTSNTCQFKKILVFILWGFTDQIM